MGATKGNPPPTIVDPAGVNLSAGVKFDDHLVELVDDDADGSSPAAAAAIVQRAPQQLSAERVAAIKARRVVRIPTTSVLDDEDEGVHVEEGAEGAE
eukprot:5796505-Prymnesium_polylepis.1